METLKIWGKEFPINENIDFRTKLNTNRTFEFVVCVKEKHLQIFPEKNNGIKILEVEKVSDAYYIRMKSIGIENAMDFIEKVAYERGYYYGNLETQLKDRRRSLKSQSIMKTTTF